jgi:short-subunit dehydrogenase
MHPYEFLKRYGPTALVMEVTAEPGETFAAELARGGFDLLLPCTDPARLEPLEARLEDHEGVEVELYRGDIHHPRFAESLYPDCEHLDIGLMVCAIEAGHPQMAGSLISSLTRMFIPRLRVRRHSGLIVIDMTGRGHRLGESLAYELKSEGVDVLMLCADSGEQSLQVRITPGDLLEAALEHMDQETVIGFDSRSWLEG